MGIRRTGGEFSEIPPGTQPIETGENVKKVKKITPGADVNPARSVKKRNDTGEPTDEERGKNLDVIA